MRELNTNAINEAKAMDAERASSGVRGPLHGLPVLIDDTIDARGLPTTAGSIALQKNMPPADSALVAKLKAAGAIILGKTNVGELNGLFDANMPEGYSSLGGQVLMAVRHRQLARRLVGRLDRLDGRGPRGADVRPGDLAPTRRRSSPRPGIAGVVALKPTRRPRVDRRRARRGQVAGRGRARSRAPSATRRRR